MGVAILAKNCRYKPTSVACRYGLQTEMTTPTADQPITGLWAIYVHGTTELQVPIVFDFSGRLFYESPIGSGVLTQLLAPQVTLPASAFLQMATAFNKGFASITDLKQPLGPNLVIDGTQTPPTVDPLSLHLMGQTWLANEPYLVGEVVTPIAVNGHQYRCIQAGTSGAAQPVFPTGAGQTVNDNGVIWQENTPSAASSGAPGNICTGTRYMVILYQTRSGYIQGMDDGGPIPVTINTQNQSITVSKIPIGPPNTIRRIVCFTLPGDFSGGRYFYIPVNDTRSGVTETSTVIQNNTQTTATFNFDDDYLESSVPVTDYFRKTKVPPAMDIYFAESLNRMIYQTNLYPSGFMVSLPGDFESVYADTGLVQVAQDNGQRAIAWREYKGTQYALKERSGHVVTENPNDPATWNVRKRWDKKGPAGPRAVDVGASFMFFAHRSGPQMFTGDLPIFVGEEIVKLWRRINWQYRHLIWVHIDEEQYEVRIGVPFDDSTICNKVFTVNFLKGWDPPIHWSPIAGKLVASPNSRKWSLDDIPATQAIRLERDLTNYPPVQPQDQDVIERDTLHTQLLLASSAPDGLVNMITPGVYNDNGAGIDQGYDTSYTSTTTGLIWQATGVTLTARGDGDLLVRLMRSRNDKDGIDISPKNFSLKQTLEDLGAGVAGQSSNRFRLRFSNGKKADSFFEVMKATIYATQEAAGPRDITEISQRGLGG